MFCTQMEYFSPSGNCQVTVRKSYYSYALKTVAEMSRIGKRTLLDWNMYFNHFMFMRKAETVWDKLRVVAQRSRQRTQKHDSGWRQETKVGFCARKEVTWTNERAKGQGEHPGRHLNGRNKADRQERTRRLQHCRRQSGSWLKEKGGRMTTEELMRELIAAAQVGVEVRRWIQAENTEDKGSCLDESPV